MSIAHLYLGALLLMSVGGFAHYLRKPRSVDEIAINILAIAAPAFLVLAYLIPDLLMHRASIVALLAITIATNWIAGKWYLREIQDEAGDEFEITAETMFAGVAVMLSPALWYGVLALIRG